MGLSFQPITTHAGIWFDSEDIELESLTRLCGAERRAISV